MIKEAAEALPLLDMQGLKKVLRIINTHTMRQDYDKESRDDARRVIRAILESCIVCGYCYAEEVVKDLMAKGYEPEILERKYRETLEK
jgi:hypothetical protein